MGAHQKQRDKVIFELYKGRGPHKYRWRARAANGRIICHSEGMLHRAAPLKTVTNMIEAIKLNQFRIVDLEK
jgi:uncharacterized protein YegP (UPF0339 family)